MGINSGYVVLPGYLVIHLLIFVAYDVLHSNKNIIFNIIVVHNSFGQRIFIKKWEKFCFCRVWCVGDHGSIYYGVHNVTVLTQKFTCLPMFINNFCLLSVEGSRAVSERDVSCARLYESSWCLVLRHGGECPAEVLALPLDSSASAHNKVHAFRTGLVGRFAINVVDDLVVVHHQVIENSLFIVWNLITLLLISLLLILVTTVVYLSWDLLLFIISTICETSHLLQL